MPQVAQEAPPRAAPTLLPNKKLSYKTLPSILEAAARTLLEDSASIAGSDAETIASHQQSVANSVAQIVSHTSFDSKGLSCNRNSPARESSEIKRSTGKEERCKGSGTGTCGTGKSRGSCTGSGTGKSEASAAPISGESYNFFNTQIQSQIIAQLEEQELQLKLKEERVKRIKSVV
eukprot:gene7705-873_t